MTENGQMQSVSYIVFEGEMARQERHIKRLCIALVIAILGILVMAGMFVWYINQYDFVSYQQDGEGINIVGDRNGVDYINGSESESTGQEEPFKFPW